MSPGRLLTDACSPTLRSHTTQYFWPAFTDTGALSAAPCHPLGSTVVKLLVKERAASGWPGEPPLSLHSARALAAATSPVKTSMPVMVLVDAAVQAIATTGPPIEMLSTWLVFA